MQCKLGAWSIARESVNQLLNEMGGTLANPAQHAEPLEVLGASSGMNPELKSMSD